MLDADVRGGRAHCVLGALPVERRRAPDGPARVLLRPEQLRPRRARAGRRSRPGCAASTSTATTPASGSTSRTARTVSARLDGGDLPVGRGRRRRSPCAAPRWPSRRRRAAPAPLQAPRLTALAAPADGRAACAGRRLGKPKLPAVDLFLFTVDPRLGPRRRRRRRGRDRRRLGAPRQGAPAAGRGHPDQRRHPGRPRRGCGRPPTAGCCAGSTASGRGPAARSTTAIAARRRRDPAADGAHAPSEVDRTLDLVAGRCGLGILIETQDAVDRAAALARRPLSRIYVGLNDLRIDRRSDRAVPAAGRRHGGRRPRRGGRSRSASAA